MLTLCVKSKPNALRGSTYLSRTPLALAAFGGPEIGADLRSVRDENITIRVPSEDKARYKAAAEERGLTLSRWVRGLMEGKRAPAPGELEHIGNLLGEVQALRFQIAQVGKNLNQLNRLVHSKQVHSIEGQDDLLDRVRRSCDDARGAVEAWDKRLFEHLQEKTEDGAEGSAP